MWLVNESGSRRGDCVVREDWDRGVLARSEGEKG